MQVNTLKTHCRECFVCISLLLSSCYKVSTYARTLSTQHWVNISQLCVDWCARSLHQNLPYTLAFHAARCFSITAGERFLAGRWPPWSHNGSRRGNIATCIKGNVKLKHRNRVVTYAINMMWPVSVIATRQSQIRSFFVLVTAIATAFAPTATYTHAHVVSKWFLQLRGWIHPVHTFTFLIKSMAL